MTKKPIKHCQVIQTHSSWPLSQRTFAFSVWLTLAKDILTTVTKSNIKVCWETRLLFCLKTLLDMTTMRRERYRILSTAKMIIFVTKINSWKLSTILKNITNPNVAGVLNPSLTERHVQMSCACYWTGYKSVITESSLL